mgnify:CR=1 FL=1
MSAVTIQLNDNVLAIIELAGGVPELAVIQSDQLILSGVEQGVLETALATYNADRETYQLEPLRAERERFISERIAQLVESRYPVYRLQMFNAIYTHAIRHGLNNRADYIETLLTWVSSATSVALTAKAALVGAPTVDGIMLVDVNLESLTATDPQVTLEAALGISD